MLKSVILWLIDKIRRWADPDYAKRADEYDSQKKVVEVTERAALEEIAIKEKEVEQISSERAAVVTDISTKRADVSRIDEEIEKVQNEKEKRTTDLAATDDDNILRGKL